MNEMQIWALYFATLAGIKNHPRNEKPVDYERCAFDATEMLLITKRNFPEHFQCPSSPQ